MRAAPVESIRYTAAVRRGTIYFMHPDDIVNKEGPDRETDPQTLRVLWV